MPVTTRLAVTSSRAFGEFTSALTLQSQVFESFGVWTAPSNVSLVANLYGEGSDGVSDSTQAASQAAAFGGVVSYPPGEINGTSPHYWSEWYDQCANLVSTMNTGSGVNTITLPSFAYNNFLIYSDDYNYRQYGVGLTGGTTVNYVAGTASLNAFNWPSTGLITYANASGTHYININFTQYNYGYAGSPATALGYTFPGGTYSGGTGYPAVPASYSNIPVTPGAMYSIDVPAGGRVIIYYYA
jgi:hypothetical protein